MAEAAAHAKRPLVISHTGARALTDHPRNTDDATIKAVADKGGVVGVYFMPFLRPTASRAGGSAAPCRACRQVAARTMSASAPTARCSATRSTRKRAEASRFSRTDQGGIAAPGEAVDVFNLVEDYNSVDRYARSPPTWARGWSKARLEKLMGGNFLRVFGEVWGSSDGRSGAHRAAFLSAVGPARRALASGPSSALAPCRPRRWLRRLEAEVGERRDRVRGAAAGAARRAAPRAERDAAEPCLAARWRCAAASLGPTPLARPIIALSPLATARCELVGGQRREDGERDAAADALDRGQQPEPVALAAPSRSRTADRRPRAPASR